MGVWGIGAGQGHGVGGGGIKDVSVDLHVYFQ